MKKSCTDFDDLFLTTNQDYGSFYSGRLQGRQINPEQIALELSLNDQVRNERGQFVSIAYDIMFDKHDSLRIVEHNRKKYKSVISRRRMKYIQSNKKTNEERQMIIKNALEYYAALTQCIYEQKMGEKCRSINQSNQIEYSQCPVSFQFRLLPSALELVANELFLLNPNITADQLAENMVAVTVPLEYLGMPGIIPTKPYPGTTADCGKTPELQRLLDQFESLKNMIDDTKQHFDSQSINSQPLEGVRYIYNPFSTIKKSSRI